MGAAGGATALEAGGGCGGCGGTTIAELSTGLAGGAPAHAASGREITSALSFIRETLSERRRNLKALFL
jgi:hypothetical protein